MFWQLTVRNVNKWCLSKGFIENKHMEIVVVYGNRIAIIIGNKQSPSASLDAVH